MEDEAPETHPDDERCELCEKSVLTYGTAHFATLEASEHREYLDVGFCSWDHLAEWVAKGRPKFDEAIETEGPFYGWDDVVEIAFFAVVAGLSGFGLLTLARLIF